MIGLPAESTIQGQYAALKAGGPNVSIIPGKAASMLRGTEYFHQKDIRGEEYRYTWRAEIFLATKRDEYGSRKSRTQEEKDRRKEMTGRGTGKEYYITREIEYLEDEYREESGRLDLNAIKMGKAEHHVVVNKILRLLDTPKRKPGVIDHGAPVPGVIDHGAPVLLKYSKQVELVESLRQRLGLEQSDIDGLLNSLMGKNDIFERYEEFRNYCITKEMRGNSVSKSSEVLSGIDSTGYPVTGIHNQAMVLQCNTFMTEMERCITTVLVE